MFNSCKDSTSESEDDEEITKLVESDINHLKSYENVINPLTPTAATGTTTSKKPLDADQLMDRQMQGQQTNQLLSAQQQQHMNFNSSSSSTNSSTNGETGGYKARQLITNGPQDFLYVSTTNDSASINGTITTDGSVNGDTCCLIAPSINAATDSRQAMVSSTSNLVQTSRICSKSYTKIPEIVNESNRVKINVVEPSSRGGTTVAKQPQQQQQPVDSTATTNTYDLNNIPMSRSVIVTSSDKNNFNRMTMSSISRHNSK